MNWPFRDLNPKNLAFGQIIKIITNWLPTNYSTLQKCIQWIVNKACAHFDKRKTDYWVVIITKNTRRKTSFRKYFIWLTTRMAHHSSCSCTASDETRNQRSIANALRGVGISRNWIDVPGCFITERTPFERTKATNHLIGHLEIVPASKGGPVAVLFYISNVEKPYICARRLLVSIYDFWVKVRRFRLN